MLQAHAPPPHLLLNDVKPGFAMIVLTPPTPGVSMQSTDCLPLVNEVNAANAESRPTFVPTTVSARCLRHSEPRTVLRHVLCSWFYQPVIENHTLPHPHRANRAGHGGPRSKYRLPVPGFSDGERRAGHGVFDFQFRLYDSTNAGSLPPGASDGKEINGWRWLQRRQQPDHRRLGLNTRQCEVPLQKAMILKLDWIQ